MTVIIIEGNIGAGKSTLAAALCDKLKQITGKTVHHIKEPVGEWKNVGESGVNLLEKFYEDMSGWGFTFQVNALTDASTNAFEALSHYMDDDVVVMERSSFSVIKLFSKLLINENHLKAVEWEILKKLDNTFPDFLSVCRNKVVIYLKTDPEVCYDRIMKRARQEEVDTITLEYIKKLHDIHEQEITDDNIKGQLVVLDGRKNSWHIELKNWCTDICLDVNVVHEAQ